MVNTPYGIDPITDRTGDAKLDVYCSLCNETTLFPESCSSERAMENQMKFVDNLYEDIHWAVDRVLATSKAGVDDR